MKNAICCEEYAYNEATRSKIRTQYQAEDKLVIGNVGTFQSAEKPDVSCRYFFGDTKIHKDSVLWLVGDGELRPQIEEKIKTTWVDKFVKIFGMVDNTREIISGNGCYMVSCLFYLRSCL